MIDGDIEIARRDAGSTASVHGRTATGFVEVEQSILANGKSYTVWYLAHERGLLNTAFLVQLLL